MEEKEKNKSKKIIIIISIIIAIILISVIAMVLIYINSTLDPTKENPFDAYGKYVNYECENKNVKWRLYYTDTKNAYLVADRNIDENILFKDIISEYIGTENIKNEQIKKYFEWAKEFNTATSNNSKATAYIVDTEKWNSYKNNTYTEYTIGGTTMDMLVASFNKVHDYKLSYKLSQNGYKVKIDDQTEYEVESISLNGLIYDEETAWIAAPSGYSEDAVYNLGSKLNYTISYEEEAGFRPVVCLKKGVRFQETEDGSYDIIYSEGSIIKQAFDYIIGTSKNKSNSANNGNTTRKAEKNKENKLESTTFEKKLEEISLRVPNEYSTVDYLPYSTQDGETGFVFV